MTDWLQDWVGVKLFPCWVDKHCVVSPEPDFPDFTRRPLTGFRLPRWEHADKPFDPGAVKVSQCLDKVELPPDAQRTHEGLV
ncbi:MAG: hypothetical protein K2W93_00675, partial [Burkholderiaceae bacterium]|nr:hypothetical protein [Burkholderiaceae bacterium]